MGKSASVLLLALLPAVWGCMDDMERDESPAIQAVREWEEMSVPHQEKAPVRRTGNVAIVVEKISVNQNEQANVDLVWQYVNEKIAVGTDGGKLARLNGIRIGVTRGGFRAALSAALQRSKSSEQQKLWLTALSGTQGSIMAGQESYVGLLLYRTFQSETLLIKNTFVGASLVIEPKILDGDNIQLKLHPRLSTREGRAIDLTELTTEVVVRHAQPMVLGGLNEASDNAGFALFSWSRSKQTKKMTLVVTPFIEGAP